MITLEERWQQLMAEMEAERLRYLDSALQSAREVLAGLLELEKAGLYKEDVRYLYYGCISSKEILVEKKDLPKYRKVLGALKWKGNHPHGRDQVEVYLRSEKYPAISLRYYTRLKPGKCRIVEETSTNLRLICQS